MAALDMADLVARTWWHGSSKPLGEVDWNHPQQGGLHLGSEEQALHRGRHLTAFRLLPGAHLVRTRDAAGGWVAKARRYRAKAEGLVYLNRHEGLSWEDIPAGWDDLDHVPDSFFAARVPRAGLSLLIIRPHAVQRLDHKEHAHG
jgi:hypothetical protein